MSETLTVVRSKSLVYQGIFDPKGLYRVINKLYKRYSFDWNEWKNSEQVFKDHRMLELDLRPYKRLSDYYKVEVRIDLIATDLKEVEVNIKGLKKKLFQGKVNFHIRAFMITDYEGAWESKPFYYLIRTMFDKFIYKGYTGRMQAELVAVVNETYEEVRSFLNMHRHYREGEGDSEFLKKLI